MTRPWGRNRAMMEHKVRKGSAIDISGYEWHAGEYTFPGPPDIKLDYVDLKRGVWIWEIARRRSDGKILARGEHIQTNWKYEPPRHVPFDRSEFESLWGR